MTYAERELAQLIPCCQATTAATTATGTSAYTSPANLAYFSRITYDSVKLKRIDMTDRDALDNTGYGGSVSTGQPTHYYEYAGSVYLWPVPTAGKSLKYYYYAEPAELTASSTAFTVPAMMHGYLQDYVLYRAFAKDAEEGRANFYRQQWETGLLKGQSNWAQRDQRDQYSVVRDIDNYPETQLGII